MTKFHENYVPPQRLKKQKGHTPRRNLAEGNGLAELRDKMLGSMNAVHEAALRARKAEVERRLDAIFGPPSTGDDK